jgi:APA family basic amino acid/polyamine antiporter
VGSGGASPRPLAVGAIVLLSIVNYLGVRPGSRVLNVLVVLKVAALSALILFAWTTPGAPGWLTGSRIDDTPAGIVTFGAALIPILFAYGGWQTANYLAEEMRDPRRHLPWSLIVGTLVVVAVYVLVNVTYLRALGLEGLAATTTPAADAAGRWLGSAGERFVAAAIAISTFGFLNHAVLAPTRVYYAMAADGAFLPALARLHPRYRTPGAAIVLQSVWAIALALTGTYGDLLGTVVFADWIFFGLSVAALFVLRRQQPDHTGFRMPGYPWLPAIFVLVAAGVVASSVHAAPVRSAVGAGLLLAGIPVYYWFTHRSRRAA